MKITTISAMTHFINQHSIPVMGIPQPPVTLPCVLMMSMHIIGWLQYLSSRKWHAASRLSKVKLQESQDVDKTHLRTGND